MAGPNNPGNARSPQLARIEQYYDAVPRLWARAEEIGPFTLFVSSEGWPYYARPTRGGSNVFTSGDIDTVLARQRELGVPQALEWVEEISPGLAADAEETAGVSVTRCPLLVLSGEPVGEHESARMLGADEPEALAAARSAISVAFGNPGTDVGSAGLEARDAAHADPHARVDDVFLRRVASGRLRQAAVYADEASGPVGGGSHIPVDEVTEIAGIGVLPAYRRRGLAAQLTCRLANDARDRGAMTVFCSAQTDDVARVYEGVGFVRVGTACIGEAGT